MSKQAEMYNDKLPQHAPREGMWGDIAARLDTLEAETALHEKISELPVRAPRENLWSTIEAALQPKNKWRIIGYSALAAAASLLLLFGVLRIGSENPVKTPTTTAVNPPKTLQQPQATNIPTQTGINTVDENTGKHPSAIAVKQSAITETAMEKKSVSGKNIQPVITSVLPQQVAVIFPDSATQQSVSISNVAEKPAAVHSDATSATTPIKDSATQTITAKPQVTVVNPLLAVINSPVIETEKPQNKGRFGVNVNYQPENIQSSLGNAVVQHVDLAVSYGNDKMYVSSGVGMAHSNQTVLYDVNYMQFNANYRVDGYGNIFADGTYNMAAVKSQYKAEEKHAYLTYNVIAGRKLFSTKKFSTWVNSGAGIAVKMDNVSLLQKTSDLVETNSIMASEVSTNLPSYNKVNFNIITGVDFKYALYKKLSLSLAPTAHWYLKPVIDSFNQKPDYFSFGFKTGLKYDF